jgi:hypothetical protein
MALQLISRKKVKFKMFTLATSHRSTGMVNKEVNLFYFLDISQFVFRDRINMKILDSCYTGEDYNGASYVPFKAKPRLYNS